MSKIATWLGSLGYPLEGFYYCRIHIRLTKIRFTWVLEDIVLEGAIFDHLLYRIYIQLGITQMP